jgi:chlorophyllase
MKYRTHAAFALPFMFTLAACGPTGSNGSGGDGCPDGQELNPISGECAVVAGGDDAGGGGGGGDAGGGDAGGINPEDAGGGDEDTGRVEPEDAGGEDAGVDPVDSGGGEEDAGQTVGDPYVSAADPWAVGPLATTSSQVSAGTDGAPVAATVWSPTAPGTYAVVVFQHGFLLSTAYYSGMLSHLASHGFVVVAPQMYAPGGLPFGKPSSAEEAADAARVWTWVAGGGAPTPAGVVYDASLFGVAGHSRGAKVSWLALNAGASGVAALAGVDPVDGTGGPGGNEPRAISGATPFSIPTLVVGTELGPEIKDIPFNPFPQACAPDGDNYAQFYESAAGAARLALVAGQGHMDMLDDDLPGCGQACTSCVDGASRAPMRATSAGLLVLHMRENLLADASAAAAFTPGSAPATYTLESR